MRELFANFSRSIDTITVLSVQSKSRSCKLNISFASWCLAYPAHCVQDLPMPAGPRWCGVRNQLAPDARMPRPSRIPVITDQHRWLKNMQFIGIFIVPCLVVHGYLACHYLLRVEGFPYWTASPHISLYLSNDSKGFSRHRSAETWARLVARLQLSRLLQSDRLLCSCGFAVFKQSSYK